MLLIPCCGNIGGTLLCHLMSSRSHCRNLMTSISYWLPYTHLTKANSDHNIVEILNLNSGPVTMHKNEKVGVLKPVVDVCEWREAGKNVMNHPRIRGWFITFFPASRNSRMVHHVLSGLPPFTDIDNWF